jgi:hypothetical protein
LAASVVLSDEARRLCLKTVELRKKLRQQRAWLREVTSPGFELRTFPTGPTRTPT